jgi:hypothetical protein
MSGGRSAIAPAKPSCVKLMTLPARSCKAPIDNQTDERSGERVYLASILSPRKFRVGIGLIGAGFAMQFIPAVVMFASFTSRP